MNFNELSEFCKSARRFASPPRIDTFFSIGGRGYYENPTSDILAYFMSDGPHGLQSVFLGGYLACLGFGEDEISELLQKQPIQIEREKSTQKGNRMDLWITAQAWSLVIEAKIMHWVANPLQEYENSASNWTPKVEKFFSILSPEKPSKDSGKWKHVSFGQLVEAVNTRLQRTPMVADSAKWRVFAEDFLLHLEQDIARKNMNQDAVEFIDKHLKDLENINRLRGDYMSFLWKNLEGLLQGLNFDSSYKLSCNWESSHFLIYIPNQLDWQIGLSGPNHKGSDGKLVVTVWSRVDDNLIKQAKENHFRRYRCSDKDGEFSTYICLDCSSASEALAEVDRLARALLLSDEFMKPIS